MSKKVGIFVPARLSSQRLPNKQILPIGDTCMFEICCRKLEELSKEYNTYVLIADHELIEIAKKYPSVKIIERDPDTCKVDGPLQYIFKEMRDVKDTHLLFLNPCLIFLPIETIRNSITKFIESEADYATSVKPIQNWIMDENLNMVNEINYQRLTTKEITPWYQTAHCFHVFNKDNFFKDGYMLKDGFMGLPIPVEETVDIDTYDEYLYAKWLWESGMFKRD